MIFVYKRVSTDGQNFDQQDNFVDQYLQKIGNPEHTLIEEKVSGSILYEDRRLSEVFLTAKKGDTIIVSDVSRIGRNMMDVFSFVGQCMKKGITVITAKEGHVFSDDMSSKAILFAHSMTSEMQLQFCRTQTKSGLRKKINKWDSMKDGDPYISNRGVTYIKGV